VGVAAQQTAGTPNPIPGGSPVIASRFGSLFHVYGPGGADPPDAEPATITDFDGDVGLAFVSGSCKRTDTTTGVVQDLPFIHNDMRFMTGVFRGTDGAVHQGAFALI
jgi:hypothetical protein